MKRTRERVDAYMYILLSLLDALPTEGGLSTKHEGRGAIFTMHIYREHQKRE
jgi:hypothetical protein